MSSLSGATTPWQDQQLIARAAAAPSPIGS
jgi:hypothetical protein